MTTPSTCVQVCGDGVKTSSEQCDDGNLVSLDGCSSTCTIESGWTCGATSPSVCTPICCDSKKVFGEVCDDGCVFCKTDCSGPVSGY